jgi:hypothetical protein
MMEGRGVYDWLARNVFGSDMSEGEVHAPQYTKKGFKFGNYIGPGTDVYNNIKKGKKPVSKADRAAQAHDLRYDRAKSNKDVRDADKKMVKKLKQISKDKGDYKFNLLIAKWPIQVKMKLEDWGIMAPGSFSSKKGVAPGDKDLNDATLARLEQEGYGKKKPWMTHVGAIKKKNPKLSYKEVLKLASKSYKK